MHANIIKTVRDKMAADPILNDLNMLYLNCECRDLSKEFISTVRKTMDDYIDAKYGRWIG
jgi:hypothetical protein